MSHIYNFLYLGDISQPNFKLYFIWRKSFLLLALVNSRKGELNSEYCQLFDEALLVGNDLFNLVSLNKNKMLFKVISTTWNLCYLYFFNFSFFFSYIFSSLSFLCFPFLFIFYFSLLLFFSLLFSTAVFKSTILSLSIFVRLFLFQFFFSSFYFSFSSLFFLFFYLS